MERSDWFSVYWPLWTELILVTLIVIAIAIDWWMEERNNKK